MQEDYFDEIEPYNKGMLKVSDLHTIYYEESGNPKGQPILFVHGGPGGGTSPSDRRYFDPEHYRIILFDQRGCGKSTPYAELKDNTTWDLVSDMEELREHLKVDKWILFGGSWGSTLALAYAVKNKSKVSGMILRGIFLGRKEEIDWLYTEGANKIFPSEYEDFLEPVKGKKGNIEDEYYKLLTSDDVSTRVKAAKAWSVWEGTIATLEKSEDLVDFFSDVEFAVALSRIECHFFVNKLFIESDNYLADEVSKLKGIPTRVVQGRYDIVCPVDAAWTLKKAMNIPDEDLRITLAGHSSKETEIKKELLQATEDFKKI